MTLQTRLPSLEIRRVGVERMVRQILINILSNAVKFTPAAGSVSLEVVPRYNGWLAISVADTGIDTSPEETQIALTPFGQVDSPLSRRHGGTDLGLPLAKSMTEVHGGRLTIINAPGEGATAELRFPPNRMRYRYEVAAVAADDEVEPELRRAPGR